MSAATTVTTLSHDVQSGLLSVQNSSKGILSPTNFLEAFVESGVCVGMTLVSPIVLLAILCLGLAKEVVDMGHSVSSAWYH